jgi:hypothetical protein
MTTDQAYDQAATGETGEAGPFLVLTDQTLTERSGESDAQPSSCNTGVVGGGSLGCRAWRARSSRATW